MSVRVPLPGPGTYALVVLHDRDANGRLSVWSDGVGFSRNPKLGLSKPDYSRVKVTLPSGTTDIDVTLNYRQGLSVRPLKRSEEHTSELQSLMRISYAVFCLKKKNTKAKQLTIVRKVTLSQRSNQY